MLSTPWPWWISGPAIGLVVTLLFLLGGRQFGLSANLRHLCAMAAVGRIPFLRYDWRREGLWNLIFVAGVVLGGFVGYRFLGVPAQPVELPPAAALALANTGIAVEPVAPSRLLSWPALATLPGFVAMVVGGFLVGFGARWAGGCTSGHAICGLAARQLPSLIAVLGFFAGGLVSVHWIVPLLLQ